MADRTSFPSIPTKNWWTLRDRFLSSPPREVNAAYLSAVLGLQDKAAANLVPSLRAIGLIDEKGKPTERAGRWRVDEHYPEVTGEIIAEIYPRALLDVAPPDNPDPTVVKRWFLRETGTGEARANILAGFYRLLAAGDPTARDEAQRRAAVRSAATARTQTRQTTTRKPPKPDGDGAESKDGGGGPGKTQMPSLSVAVQVYIDKDMTAEQVDHVFASMARHLYGKQ
jgi:hypothetical protein